MSITRHWESDGASATYYEGRLSIIAKPSMTADDGSVAVGIDAPWIDQLTGAVDLMRESRIARARGLAQAIAECRDDARLDGIREGAAEIVQLLGRQ